MRKEDVNKMFIGKWNYLTRSRKHLDNEEIKNVCRDFFETGFFLAFSDTEVKETVSTESFETFWNLYEKKVGRPKCEKLWQKLTKEEQNACLEYIPQYKLAQPDKQYRKNPETFLRNKSWNDELIFRNRQPSVIQQRFDKLANILTD